MLLLLSYYCLTISRVVPCADKANSHHPTVNGIDAFLRGNDHVEDEEMSFETIWYVVFARSWVVHRAHVLQVFDYLHPAECGFRDTKGADTTPCTSKMFGRCWNNEDHVHFISHILSMFEETCLLGSDVAFGEKV